MTALELSHPRSGHTAQDPLPPGTPDCCNKEFPTTVKFGCRSAQSSDEYAVTSIVSIYIFNDCTLKLSKKKKNYKNILKN